MPWNRIGPAQKTRSVVPPPLLKPYPEKYQRTRAAHLVKRFSVVHARTKQFQEGLTRRAVGSRVCVAASRLERIPHHLFFIFRAICRRKLSEGRRGTPEKNNRQQDDEPMRDKTDGSRQKIFVWWEGVAARRRTGPQVGVSRYSTGKIKCIPGVYSDVLVPLISAQSKNENVK